MKNFQIVKKHQFQQPAVVRDLVFVNRARSEFAASSDLGVSLYSLANLQLLAQTDQLKKPVYKLKFYENVALEGRRHERVLLASLYDGAVVLLALPSLALLLRV